MVPAAVDACRVAVPVPQIDAPVVEVSVGAGFTVIVKVLLIAEAQTPFVTFAR